MGKDLPWTLQVREEDPSQRSHQVTTARGFDGKRRDQCVTNGLTMVLCLLSRGFGKEQTAHGRCVKGIVVKTSVVKKHVGV